MKGPRGPPPTTSTHQRWEEAPRGRGSHLGRATALGLPPRGPHLPQNMLHQFLGGALHHGGPPTTFHQMWAAPQWGPHQKIAPHESWDLVPHPGTLMFFTRVLSEKILRRSQNISGTLQKVLGRVPKPFWLDGLLRNNFLVSPKLFRFSLRNIFGVSETFR